MATSCTPSEDARQSFAASVPLPPQPMSPTRIVAARPANAGVRARASPAAVDAVTVTKRRRVIFCTAHAPCRSAVERQAQADAQAPIAIVKRERAVLRRVKHGVEIDAAAQPEPPVQLITKPEDHRYAAVALLVGCAIPVAHIPDSEQRFQPA